MGKIMRVNLSELKVKVEDIPKEYRRLGGRGLTSHIIGSEVPPMADPLGPENKLVFSAGILAGTTVPSSGRLSVGAKSPLTNTIKEANSGGSAAQKLARLGLQAVVIEDLNTFLRGWIGYYRLVETRGVIRDLASWIRRRLRYSVLKRWINSSVIPDTGSM